MGLTSREGGAELSLGLEVELSVCAGVAEPSDGPTVNPDARLNLSAVLEPWEIDVGRVDAGSDGVEGREAAALAATLAEEGFLGGPEICGAIWTGSGWPLARFAPEPSGM